VPKVWLDLQNDYDQEEAKRAHTADFDRIPAFTQKAA
jgi:plasmid maintenance system antidote protein VapI